MLFHPLRLAILLFVSTFFFACNSLGQHPEEGGILENISNEVLAKTLMDKALILDIRTPEETQLGIIEGATIINLYDDDFEAKIQLLEKSKPIVVYCASGGRSSQAAAILAEQGFMEVYNLKGGLYGWQNEGLPVTKVLNDLESAMITKEELTILVQESNAVLLDFYAPWCAPCKAMAPIIEDIEKAYGEIIHVERVDVAANPELGKTFNVSSIPVFAIYRKGKEVWRSNGLTEKSILVDEIKKALE
ncbi:MAG TPA: thioredoxin [Bacteroidetes bacterium]|nr:thioredoxin [Bacteroidota bacterium]